MKKSILQISFSMFKQILTYKCAINGVYVSLVDSKNTSKSCSKYGNINDIHSMNGIGLHDDQSSNRMQQALLVKKRVETTRLV